MDHPHDATQSFPAGGAPPPPPPEHTAPPSAPTGPPAAPTGPPAGEDVTRVSGEQGPFAVPGAPAPGPPPGYAPAPPGYGQPSPYPQHAPIPPGAGPGVAPTAAPPPTAPPARKGRILGRALLVLVVIGALGATTAWGFVNRSSAEEWRDRSETPDADLVEALDRLEATSSDLDDARTRLRDLANENAGETDRNRILSDIVAAAPEVTAALADCQQMTAELANDIIALLGDPAADTTGLEARTDDVNEVCAAALDEAQALEEAIEGLGI